MSTKLYPKIASACFITGLICSIALQRIGLKYFFPVIPPRIMLVITLLFFISFLSYTFIFLRQRVKNHAEPLSLLIFWQNALRYIIALDMSVFGICKFFRIQFNTPLALLDNPFNTLADDDLMWAFFGHSYVYTLLIGAIELTGALLLLFRNTRLLGVFTLLPVALNIFFLDIFYNGVVTSVYIGIEIIGLVYLLWIEYPRLIAIFWVNKEEIAHFYFKNKTVKNLIKLSVIVIPFTLMAINKYPQYYPEINGKYLVKKLVVDKKVI